MTLQEIMRTYHDKKEGRDVAFIFAWQLARVLAHGHARGHDAELLSDRLTASMMGHLDGRRFDPEKGPLAPFLTYVCWGAGLQAAYDLDMHNPQGEAVDVDNELDEDALLYETQPPELRALFNAVQTLPNQNWRDTMLLKYQRGHTNVEIGDILGVPESTVNQWHNRALKALREKIHA